MSDQDQEHYYRFSHYSDQLDYYGYGTEQEAKEYCQLMNKRDGMPEVSGNEWGYEIVDSPDKSSRDNAWSIEREIEKEQDRPEDPK